MTEVIWQQISSQLEKELSTEDFNTYIKPIRSRVSGGDTLTLLAHNKHIFRKVKERYLSRIWELMDGHGPSRHLIDIALEIGTGEGIGDIGAEPLKSSRIRGSISDRALGHVSTLSEEKTFENFVAGTSNQWAKTVAIKVAETSGDHAHNPLLLYGDVGLGKTHLMQAVGNALLAGNKNMRVVYMQSNEFLDNMVRAIESATMNDFAQYFMTADALLIDDIQFFADKQKCQEEFFHVFNALEQARHQMVFTCDKYPREIDRLDDRLSSRCINGLTAELKRPDLETRAAILIRKSELRGVELDIDIAMCIANHVKSNVRELQGALSRVLLSAPANGAKLTIEHVQSVLDDLVPRQPTSPEQIIEEICNFFNLSRAELCGISRQQRFVRPRHLAMVLIYELTNLSYKDVGEWFGKRDHATVINACKRIDELRKDNQDVATAYDKLRNRLDR